MKAEILKLKDEGKTNKEICKILNCAKSTIAYHTNGTSKDKSNIALQKRRKLQSPLIRKLQSFKERIKLKSKCERFQNRNETEYKSQSFSPKDIISKFGENPTCYLSGRKLNWNDSSTYTLDHIIPVSKGGNNTLDNLQICHPNINLAKSGLLNEEFIELCKEVLIHNGYKIGT